MRFIGALFVLKTANAGRLTCAPLLIIQPLCYGLLKRTVLPLAEKIEGELANDKIGPLLYILIMANLSLPLSKTNPFLKNRAKRQEGLIRTVISSSAIEGIHGVVISEADFSAIKSSTSRRKSSSSAKPPR